MSDKKVRLSELAKIHPIAGMDHRDIINEKGQPFFLKNISRIQRRILAAEAKRIAREYNKILRNLAESGARFPADKILREMAIEYNHRYASSGIYNQPVNFNYFEPFLHLKLIKKMAPYVEIEKEFDHLFNAEDYFDFITSEGSNGFEISSLLELPQDQIFHFSVSGSLTDFSFLNGEGREFIVAGFSMIRRGESLHWYLVGGEALDEDEWKLRSSNQMEADLKYINPQKRAFLTELLAENGMQRGKPCALPGADFYIRTIALGEFDLKEKKHMSRCFLDEYENSFDVVCDDPEILTPLGAEILENTDLLDAMVARFNKKSVMWALAEGFFQLPSYFNTRVIINKNSLADTSKRISKKKGGKGLIKDYVVIPSLEKSTSAPTSTITLVKLPHYEIETEGHWRRLKKDEAGIDRHGNKILGRTWIASSSKWKPTASDSIYFKDTLAAAKLKISEYIQAANVQQINSLNTQEASDEGELYIMRCAAMKDQIFKVGYTCGNSHDRAQQLSAATGVPLSFVVVKKWKHKKARQLETEVHIMLSQYRISDNREFFIAEYKKLEAIIELVLLRTDQ